MSYNKPIWRKKNPVWHITIPYGVQQSRMAFNNPVLRNAYNNPLWRLTIDKDRLRIR